MSDDQNRPRCAWDLGAELGEGPLWDEETRRLWFVDILGGRIHSLAESGERHSVEVGGMPCFIVRASDGGFVIGNENRLEHFDGERITGTLLELDLPERHRLNDATVDPAGRLWFGSMDMDTRAATGLVHVYDRGRVHVAGGASIITNGPAVSSDGRWLYHVDTLGGLIWRFDISGGPLLDRGEIFARINPADGTPDGVTIDAEDHLWVGLWNGWAARRYAPDGRIERSIPLPCANVTKVAFGGADLGTMYVTTAHLGLSPEERADQPLAGALFAIEGGVSGAPAQALALSG